MYSKQGILEVVNRRF